LYNEGSKPFSFHHADKGASLQAYMPSLGRHGDAQVVDEHDVVAGGLQEVEMNLWGLMMGVPPLKR